MAPPKLDRDASIGVFLADTLAGWAVPTKKRASPEPDEETGEKINFRNTTQGKLEIFPYIEAGLEFKAERMGNT